MIGLVLKVASKASKGLQARHPHDFAAVVSMRAWRVAFFFFSFSRFSSDLAYLTICQPSCYQLIEQMATGSKHRGLKIKFSY